MGIKTDKLTDDVIILQCHVNQLFVAQEVKEVIH